MEFDPEVEEAIKEQVPVFFHAVVRDRLESFAREKGVDRVTMEVFKEAKAKYLSGQM
ncbi:MAG TPA: PCP reductase family protein [Planctomycetota bacterium]|nr:PCP reductase family protein [Planctomycetota bacterium]